MSIGSGIAIAGVWIFAGLMGHSKTVTSEGMLLAIAIAGGVTFFLAGH
jgi:hypothetical protein